MKRFNKMLIVVLLAVLTCGISVDDAFARRGGGSFRSSPSRSFRSSPSRSTRSSGSKTTRSTKVTSSKRTVTKPKRTAAQQKKYESAKKGGTLFKSKKAAQADFKAKHAKSYPSKYATKPAKRPAHIPANTTVGGNTYNVSYNSQYGGYGYMGVGGTWMAYNAMRDVAMMSILMDRRGYHVEAPMAHSTVVHRSGPSVGSVLSIFGCIVGGIVLIVIVIAIVGKINS